MNYLWTTLHVNNLEESLDFYEGFLGLRLNNRYMAGPGMELAFLGEGNTQIELVCAENSKVEDAGKGISMGFQVESLEDTLDALEKKGIPVSKGIIQPNPHIKFFFVKDTDGYEIQFVEMIS